MVDKGSSKVLKAGIGYTIGNYLIKGLGFFTIPIFARLMTTEDYGIYNTYAAYDGIFFVIIGLALHSSFKNAKYKYKNDLEKYISSCVGLSIVNLGLWLIIGNIFYFAYSGTIEFSRFIINILILNSYANAIILYFNVYVGLDYHYKLFLKIAAVNAISSVILSIILILNLGDGYLGRIWGTAVPAITISIYIICFFFRKAKPQFNKEYWKYALNYSLPIIPHGLSQVVLSQFDRIMITNMVGKVESGVYSFGYNIYTLINVTATALDNVWGPWFYEQMNAKNYIDIRKKSSMYALGMLAFSTIIVFVAPEMVVFLGGSKYSNATYIVIPIVIGGFFSFLYTLPVQVEYFYEKTKFIATGTICAALLNIILNFIFIKHYGYVAAAYTTLITYFLYFVFHYILANIIHKCSIYNTKHMIIISIVAFSEVFLALVLINLWVLRWIIA